MNILNEIAAYAVKRVQQAESKMPLEAMKEQALALPGKEFVFEHALRKPELSFICECKKASPSKGIIADDFPYLKIAQEYEQAGADCISVLTEHKYFLGDDSYLQEIAHAVSVPCLRKDFVVVPYMIYEARVLGAAAVLLICSLLTEKELAEYLEICEGLGMSALVEVHNAAEISMAIHAGARIIGVNNRNLSDFSVDMANSSRLRELVPPEILFVAESGIKTAADIQTMREIGADAVLIGELLIRAENRSAMLAELRRGR